MDETNKSMDASELSADDLQQVTGGSTPTNLPKITVIEKSPIVTESNPGKGNVSWDIAENTVS
jgi:bacteriocin-like protein